MKKILVYWRDIPSQVIVQKGRVREKYALSQRFQEAIDRAAMRAGKGSSDAYIEEWRREATQCDGVEDMQAYAKSEAERLEAAFDQERLDRMIRHHGLDRD